MRLEDFISQRKIAIEMAYAKNDPRATNNKAIRDMLTMISMIEELRQGMLNEFGKLALANVDRFMQPVIDKFFPSEKQ